MIAIIKYNAGNISSVQNALNRLGCNSLITDDVETILKADKVILPGVGEASTAMEYLKEKRLDQVILSLKQPMLGICLGLQLMCKYSEEGETECLGIFDAEVKHFPKTEIVPHMGWNNFTSLKSPLFNKVEKDVALCDYILPFSAAMNKNNYYASQFHPEKSAEVGAQILKNFLEL